MRKNFFKLLMFNLLLFLPFSSHALNEGLKLKGYADVGTSWIDQDKLDVNGRGQGAYIGTLDFYMTPRITDNVLSLIEFAFAGNNGNVGFGLHRMQIGYEFNDMLTFWLGRFHLPVGYYNTAYHHGAQLQTALERPKFIAYEKNGAIFPMHDVGSWLSGQVKLGGERLHYDLFVVNGNLHKGGHSELVFSSNNTTRQRDDYAYGLRLGVSLDDSLEGFKAGVSYYKEKIGGHNETWLYNLHILFINEDAELILEAFKFDNKDVESGEVFPKSYAGYGQLAFHLNDHFTPYGRYEISSLDENDPYFTNLKFTESYERYAFGLRYNFNYKACLKFEALMHDFKGGNGFDYKQVLAQYAIGF